ncbi:domain-containing protein [Stylonychia lemnae]|uniref:Domain-containing protein n=1 Tax=Stylonychia lemnae TaxID=5949 RepID=A0A078A5S5_STYLE|nr:domain-containing protein [Stylonychia lemnae]|eukprot:CDW76114.1 domain-containing protein [Stylonychia lemnae]
MEKNKKLTFICEVESKFEEEENQTQQSGRNSNDVTTEDFTTVQYTQDSDSRSLKRMSKRITQTEIERKEYQRMMDAYEYLINKGILANLGTNKEGMYYFVIYGYAYTKAYDSKEKIKIGEAFQTLSDYLTTLYKWVLIYVHSCVGATRKGALIKFKEIYCEMTQAQKATLSKLYIIQPSLFVKIKMFINQFQIDESDSSMIARFIKQLPQNVFEVYQKELKIKNKKQYPSEIDQLETKESYLLPTMSSQDDQVEPEFLKKFFSLAVNESVVNQNQGFKEAIQSTHDVIGKNLKIFYQEREDDQDFCEEIPFVLMQIHDYFMENDRRMWRTDLFGKLSTSEMKLLDRLESNIALGNYSYIFSEQDSRIVAFYFKSILKYMEEPLSTFKLYENFKEACQIKKTQDNKQIFIGHLKQIFQRMDSVYFYTWKMVLHILATITLHSKINNVRPIGVKIFIQFNPRNLAQIFSDILFRPKTYGANDMIMWKHFTDLLAFMIENHQDLFDGCYELQLQMSPFSEESKSQ